MNHLNIYKLGKIDYQTAWDFQTKLQMDLIQAKRTEPQHEIRRSTTRHALIICEHPHVYTLGKSGSKDNLLKTESDLETLDAQFVAINRGGDITYHGPGQLVAYPILDLDLLFNDVHRYVRSLEESIILTLADFNISGTRIKEFTGVWLQEQDQKAKKICAIGVHISRWVTLHGLAFNVNTELDYFNHIIPCGINPNEKEVTSLQRELGESQNMELVIDRFIHHFTQVFEFKQISYVNRNIEA